MFQQISISLHAQTASIYLDPAATEIQFILSASVHT